MSACKFEYQEKEGEIIVITWTPQGDTYEFYVHQNREDALSDLWNAWKCHYAVIFCSDDSVIKEHEREIKKESRIPHDLQVVDKEGMFYRY